MLNISSSLIIPWSLLATSKIVWSIFVPSSLKLPGFLPFLIHSPLPLSFPFLCSFSPLSHSPPSPAFPSILFSFLNKVINHLNIQNRNFLSENPQNRIPGDYEQYPGKVDHTSIACVKVGRYDSQVTEVLPTKTPKIDLVEFKKGKQKVIDAVKLDIRTNHGDIYEEFFVQNQPPPSDSAPPPPGSLNSPPTSPNLTPRDQAGARKSTWLVVKPSNIQ